MNKNKEVLELKKLYLLQIEKWESKFFFTILALSISLILFSIKGLIPLWVGIVLYLVTTIIVESVFEIWRTKKFNELKKEIETGKFKDMKIMPMKFYKKNIANYRNAQLVRTYANDDLRGEFKMKRIKQDKQFMIQFDQNNRDFLINISMFTMSVSISIIALLISTISLVISLNGINSYSIALTIIISVLIIIFIIPISIKIQNNIKNSFKINKQLQDRLFELYPEYKNKFH